MDDEMRVISLTISKSKDITELQIVYRRGKHFIRSVEQKVNKKQ